MVWSRRRFSLQTVFILPLLVSIQGGVASLLKCYCSDCTQTDFCYGSTCFAQATVNLEDGGVDERWRCSNDTAVCEVSNSFISFACCNSYDLCNAEIHATFPGTSNNNSISSNETTSNVCSNFTATNLTDCSLVNGTVLCENSTETTENITECTDDVTTAAVTTPTTSETTPTTSGTKPTTAVTTPPTLATVPIGSTFECYEAESHNPHVFNISFCETNKSCYMSLRVRSDGSREFRWGCSRDGPSHSCVEESRNRKKKACCRNWFCNKDIPSDWLDENEITTITTTTTTEATPTTPSNSTSPGPAILTTNIPPSDESPNCTLSQDAPSGLSHCAGPGSVEDSTDPIPATEPTIPVLFICYCNTCADSFFCFSFYGCTTIYHYVYDLTAIGGVRIENRRFCMSKTTNKTCGVAPGQVCCYADMCNAPVVTTNETTTTTPTEGSECNDTLHPITDPITDPITVPTTATPTNSTATDSVNPSEADEEESTQQQEDELSLLFYSLVGVLVTLVTALIPVLLLLCICCYGYQKRLKSTPKNSTVAPRCHVVSVTTESRFNSMSPNRGELREWSSSSERIAAGSKVECTTESTETVLSVPEESTV